MVTKKCLSAFIIIFSCLYTLNNNCSMGEAKQKNYHSAKKHSSTSVLPIPFFYIPNQKTYIINKQFVSESDLLKKIQLGNSYLQDLTKEEQSLFFDDLININYKNNNDLLKKINLGTSYLQSLSLEEQSQLLGNLINMKNQENIDAKDEYIALLQQRIYTTVASATQQDDLIKNLSKQATDAYFKCSEHELTKMNHDEFYNILSQPIREQFNEKSSTLSYDKAIALSDALDLIERLVENKVNENIETNKRKNENLLTATKEQQEHNALELAEHTRDLVIFPMQQTCTFLAINELGQLLGTASGSLLNNQAQKNEIIRLEKELLDHNLEKQIKDQNKEILEIVKSNEQMINGNVKKRITKAELLQSLKKSLKETL